MKQPRKYPQNSYSVGQRIAILLLYGFASDMKERVLGSSGEEISKKSESCTNNSSKQEGSSIRGHLTEPSQDRHWDYYQRNENSSPNEQSFSCPLCGASLSLNLNLCKTGFSIDVLANKRGNLRNSLLHFWGNQKICQSKRSLFFKLRRGLTLWLLRSLHRGDIITQEDNGVNTNAQEP